MKLLSWRSATTILSTLVVAGFAQAAEPSGKKLAAFGSLEAASPDAVRVEAEAWLKKSGLTGDQQKQFQAIWKAADRPLTDRVVDTLMLEPKAAQLLACAHNPFLPAPCGPDAVPAIVHAIDVVDIRIRHLHASSNRHHAKHPRDAIFFAVEVRLIAHLEPALGLASHAE